MKVNEGLQTDKSRVRLNDGEKLFVDIAAY